MTTLFIDRWYHDDCTIGRATIKDNDFQCFSLELPDLDNQINISCIPHGTYECEKISDTKFSIKNVPNRTYIQGHIGNFVTDIQGCVIFGDRVLFSDGVPMVGNSQSTFSKLMNNLPNVFDLIIS